MTLQTTYLCDGCSKALDPTDDAVSVSVLHVNLLVSHEPARAELHYHNKCFDRERWPEVELPAPAPLPEPEPPKDATKQQRAPKAPAQGEPTPEEVLDSNT